MQVLRRSLFWRSPSSSALARAQDRSLAFLHRVEAAWRAAHDRFAPLSTRGDNTIVPGARQYIQIDRPQAVVGAVMRLE